MAFWCNGGVILPRVDRLLGVTLFLSCLVGYDDPECKPGAAAPVCARLEVCFPFLWKCVCSQCDKKLDLIQVSKHWGISLLHIAVWWPLPFHPVPYMHMQAHKHRELALLKDIWALKRPDGGCRLGACMHVHISVPISVWEGLVSAEIEREGGRERAREREHENTGYTGIFKSSLQTVYFFFLPFLPCVLPYLEHIPVEILCGDAIGSVRFPFYSQLCSYQSRWLTVGRRRGTYQCNHRERRAPVHRQHTKHIRAPEWKWWRSWHSSTSNCVCHLFPGEASCLGWQRHRRLHTEIRKASRARRQKMKITPDATPCGKCQAIDCTEFSHSSKMGVWKKSAFCTKSWFSGLKSPLSLVLQTRLFSRQESGVSLLFVELRVKKKWLSFISCYSHSQPSGAICFTAIHSLLLLRPMAP